VGFFGGCACLFDVISGSSMVDSCATQSRAQYGGLVFFGTGAEVVLKGLAVFDCQSAFGALDHVGPRANVVGSNLTCLKGEWGSYECAAAICPQRLAAACDHLSRVSHVVERCVGESMRYDRRPMFCAHTVAGSFGC
jgi:hypothetical protein